MTQPRDCDAALVHPLATESVSPDAIRRQRELNWPDFHPEKYCHRCGRLNVWSWSAPSPLWNAVMDDQPYGIVCPSCFALLAETSGAVEPNRHTWHFAPEAEARATPPALDVLAIAHEALNGWEMADGMVDQEFRIFSDPPCEDEARIDELRAILARLTSDSGEPPA